MTEAAFGPIDTHLWLRLHDGRSGRGQLGIEASLDDMDGVDSIEFQHRMHV